METIKLFYSYSEEDEEYRLEIEKSLRMLERYNGLLTWSFRKIPPGKDWDKTIKAELESSDIILLLVSRDFLASDYSFDIEVKRAMELYEEGKAIVIPIILRDCDWKHENCPFKELEGLPEKAKPIKDWEDKDRAYNDIAQKLKLSINEVIQKKENAKVDIINSIPVSPNKLSDYPNPRPYFYGREKELEEFKNAIDSKSPFILIDGGGGIGKTQFVSRCIEKYIDPTKVIYYDCNTASQLDTLITEAGYPDLLKGSSKTDKEKFYAFKNKIQDNEFYLFLDNFQETNNTPVFKEFLKFIQDYLKKGCIVVIDRDDIRTADLSPKRIHIEGFKKDKLEYAKALINYSYQNEINITDDELDILCDKLQGYPLAIDFAVNLLSTGVSSTNIIKTIAQDGDVRVISERLLNAIFSRPDATQEEQDFIRQFSVFTGGVSEQTITSVISISLEAARKLQKKNLLTLSNGLYEIHPLVRELCYNELEEKELLHDKVAEYFIKQRSTIFNPSLEEQIFYHLEKSNQWNKIGKDIETNGRNFIRQGQLSLLKEILDKLQENNIKNPIFNIYYGNISDIQGKWLEAKNYFDLVRFDSSDKKIQTEGLIKYGDIMDQLGELKESFNIFEEAFKIAKENNFEKEIAWTHASFGHYYEIMGDYTNSLRNYKDALKISEQTSNNEDIATSLGHLASIYIVKKTLVEAIKCNDRSLKIYQDIGDKYGIGIAIGRSGRILFDKDNSDLNALEMFEKSLNLFRELGAIGSISDALNEIGLFYKKNGNLDLAIINYNESLAIHEEIGNKYGIAASFHNIGTLYADQKLKKFDKAIFYLFKSLGIYNQIGVDRSNTYNWIVDIRDKKIGIEKFKALAKEAFENLPDDLKRFINLKELCKEPIIAEKKVGRNDPCPCGSGKKYKNCHGKG